MAAAPQSSGLCGVQRGRGCGSGGCRELGCAPSQPSLRRPRPGPAGLARPGARGHTCEGSGGDGAHPAAPGAVHPRVALGTRHPAFHRSKMASLGSKRKPSQKQEGEHLWAPSPRGSRLCRGGDGSEVGAHGCTGGQKRGCRRRGRAWEEISVPMGEAAVPELVGFAAVRRDACARVCVRVCVRAGGIISSYSSTSHSKCFLKASIH